MDSNEKNAERVADNIIQLGETKAQAKADPTSKAGLELDQKRKIMQRAAEIMVVSLENDALNLEKAAIVGEHTIQHRHNLMDTARCIRTTITWIVGPQTNPPDPMPPQNEPSPIIQP